MNDAEIYLDKEDRKAHILAINVNPFFEAQSSSLKTDFTSL